MEPARVSHLGSAARQAVHWFGFLSGIFPSEMSDAVLVDPP